MTQPQNRPWPVLQPKEYAEWKNKQAPKPMRIENPAVRRQTSFNKGYDWGQELYRRGEGKHAVRSAFLWGMLAGFAACAVLSEARAETTIGAHIGSWHSEPGYNNVNPGLYVVHNGWTVGGYRNSIRKDSFYAGYTFQYAMGRVIPSLTAGAITGYRTSPAPLLAPSLAIQATADFRVRILYLPKVRFTGAHVLHLAIERNF